MSLLTRSARASQFQLCPKSILSPKKRFGCCCCSYDQNFRQSWVNFGTRFRQGWVKFRTKFRLNSDRTRFPSLLWTLSETLSEILPIFPKLCTNCCSFPAVQLLSNCCSSLAVQLLFLLCSSLCCLFLPCSLLVVPPLVLLSPTN